MMDRVSGGPLAIKRLRKDYVPGYSAVLVRSEVKERLNQFRQRTGLLMESQVERCLVTAAFELVLGDAALHGRWIELFKRAVSADCALTMRDVRVVSEDLSARR